MLLVKLPVTSPEIPSVVLLSDVVGFCEVLQQTPLTIIGDPPLLVMLPPPVAVFDVKLVIVFVVIEGTVVVCVVVKLTWLPYAVPALLEAYART